MTGQSIIGGAQLIDREDANRAAYGGFEGQATSMAPTSADRLTLDADAYRDLWQTARDAAILVDPSTGRIIEANAATELLYDLSRDELLSRTIGDLRAPDSRVMIASQMREALEHGLLFETDHITAGGVLSHVEVSSRGVKLGDRVVLHSSIRDITERVQAEQRLREANLRLQNIAKVDQLTGAPNRLAGIDYLRAEYERMQRTGAPYSVLMIDVDHFKAINDTFGHAAGDDALRKIAHLLMNSVRQADVVARFGGEEFIAILPGTNAEGATNVAESLRRTVEVQGSYLDRTLTVSIGISEALPSDVDEMDAIGRADHCMYEAKDAGRNRVSCCDTSCGPLKNSDHC